MKNKIQTKIFDFLWHFVYERGWLHALTLFAIWYVLSYAVHTEWFMTEKFFLIAMIRDLSLLNTYGLWNTLGSACIQLIIAYGMGYAVEWIQGKFFNGKWQEYDIYWGQVGIMICWLIFAWIGYSKYLMMLVVGFLVIVTFETGKLLLNRIRT